LFMAQIEPHNWQSCQSKSVTRSKHTGGDASVLCRRCEELSYQAVSTLRDRDSFAALAMTVFSLPRPKANIPTIDTNVRRLK